MAHALIVLFYRATLLLLLLVFVTSKTTSRPAADGADNVRNQRSPSTTYQSVGEYHPLRHSSSKDINIDVNAYYSPTIAPTFSPSHDVFCRSLTGNDSFSTCSACVLANCRYCSSGDYCFGNFNNATCSSWKEGSSDSVCYWRGDLIIVVVIVVIVIILICGCIGGGVALCCCGVPACCASVCYICVKKTNGNSSQSTVVPTNASYAPVQTYGESQIQTGQIPIYGQPTPVGQPQPYNNQTQFGAPQGYMYSQESQDQSKHPYQIAQPAAFGQDKEYTPLAQVVSIDSNFQTPTGGN